MADQRLHHYTLHVRSAVPGREAGVRAAIFCQGGAEPLRFIERETPFSLAAHAALLTAVIRRETGAEQIAVELVGPLDRQRAGAPTRTLSSATGTNILLGEGLLPDIPSFIRGA